MECYEAMMETYYAASETMTPEELQEALEGMEWDDPTPSDPVEFDSYMEQMAHDWEAHRAS